MVIKSMYGLSGSHGSPDSELDVLRVTLEPLVWSLAPDSVCGGLGCC